MRFFFAWADKSENFAPHHQVEDEDVFAFSIQHSEGDFPTADVDIRNPRVGLLSAARKQWAWISYLNDGETGDATPLFYGRLMGVPQQMSDEVVRLTFISRPPTYSEDVATLADTLRVSPFYDALWFSADERLDSNRVLEGRPALWHIDRVNLTVTYSDITQGEDGLIDFPASDVAYDSVRVSFGQTPLRRIDVTATVQWTESGSGTLDLTQKLLDKFATAQPERWAGFFTAEVHSLKGVIATVAGDRMIDAWPKKGQTIGGGWFVGESSATLVGNAPTVPVLLPDRSNIGLLNTFNQPKMYLALHSMFSTPGFFVDVQNLTTALQNQAFGFFGLPFSEYSGEIKALWIPIWKLAPTLKLDWNVSRDRSETLTFSVNADVQPLLTDAGDDDVEQMTVGPVNVDGYIGDSRRNHFYSTDRGVEAMQHLLARARTVLLARARAVDVDFEVPFSYADQMSCRKSARIVDPRLPGGQAEGKIKRYAISVDGDSGSAVVSVTIGCTIGRSGTVTAVAGTPTYVEDGYVADEYQQTTGGVVVPIAGAIGYTDFRAYPIPGGEVSLYNISSQRYLKRLTVSGGVTEQQDASKTGGTAGSAKEVVDRINGYQTTIDVVMHPITGGPFAVTIPVTVTDLVVPRTIDLEDTGTTI